MENTDQRTPLEIKSANRYREFANELRDMAEMFESQADNLPMAMLGVQARIAVYLSSKDDLDKAKKALTSGTSINNPLEKNQTDWASELNRKFGESEVQYWVSRDTVCERVQVGTERVPVVKKIETGEYEDKPIYEWKCD